MISLRTDPEIEAALAELGATPGTRSQIVREAILDAARRVGEPGSIEQVTDNLRSAIVAANEVLHTQREQP